MSLITVLRKEVKILWSCVNHQRTGRKLIEVSTRWKPKIVSRTLFNVSQNSPPNDKIVAFFQRKDKIPGSFHLIYRVPNTFGFTAAHTLILIIIFCLPIAYLTIAEMNNYKLPIQISQNVLIKSIKELSIYTGFLFLMITFTVLLVKRFPLRIYHNKSTDEYFAVFSDFFRPWTTTPTKFKRGQVKIIPEYEFFPYQISNYKINGTKVIFIEDHFFRPIDLEYMMSSSTNTEQ